MRLRILLLLILSSSWCFSQSKDQYLKTNRFDLRSSDFDFPQADFKIIGFGAYHGAEKTEKAEHLLLDNLLKHKRIKYYLPETDFGIGYYLNEYLKSGDTVLLKDLVKHYGLRVPQEKSIETYQKWKDLKALNDRELVGDRLTVVGIDVMVSYKYSAKLLLECLPMEKGKFESYDHLVNMLKMDTTDYSPNYDSYAKHLLKAFVNTYQDHNAEFQAMPGKKSLVDHLMENMKQTFKKSGREKVIFDNYLALSPLYNFKDAPQFVRMGFFHMEKDRENNNPSFFTRLIENKVYGREEVISIAGFLTKSRVLWDVQYNAQKQYTRYTTQGGFGIGDYWKEYFKGIAKFKRNKLSDLTLFRLNQPNSPYKNNQTDLMEIKGFLKKSNKADLKGKSTTNYFDYAMLISDAVANRPIEELDK